MRCPFILLFQQYNDALALCTAQLNNLYNKITFFVKLTTIALELQASFILDGVANTSERVVHQHLEICNQIPNNAGLLAAS